MVSDRAGMPGSLGRAGASRNRDWRPIGGAESIGTIACTHHPPILAPE